MKSDFLGHIPRLHNALKDKMWPVVYFTLQITFKSRLKSGSQMKSVEPERSLNVNRYNVMILTEGCPK